MSSIRKISVRICAAVTLAMLIGASLAGCTDTLQLAPAEGKVTLDGRPVADAGVLFQPKSGPSAAGTTDAAGHFSLSTANRPGAPLGDYSVAITKTSTPELPRGADGRVDETQLRGTVELTEANYLPARYSSPSTSELTATVKPDGNNFTFSLTSDDTIDTAEEIATLTEAAASPAGNTAEASPTDVPPAQPQDE